MFKIIDVSNGEQLSLAESVNYIKKAGNGCYVHASKEDAQGVSINGGNVYRLIGKELDGVQGTVVVSECNGGDRVARLEAQADYIAMMTDVDLSPLTEKVEEVQEDEQ